MSCLITGCSAYGNWTYARDDRQLAVQKGYPGQPLSALCETTHSFWSLQHGSFGVPLIPTLPKTAGCRSKWCQRKAHRIKAHESRPCSIVARDHVLAFVIPCTMAGPASSKTDLCLVEACVDLRVTLLHVVVLICQTSTTRTASRLTTCLGRAVISSAFGALGCRLRSV